HARAARGLEAELTEGNVTAARREPGVATLELLAVLGAFGLQHLLTSLPSRRSPRRWCATRKGRNRCRRGRYAAVCAPRDTTRYAQFPSRSNARTRAPSHRAHPSASCSSPRASWRGETSRASRSAARWNP